MAASGFNSNDTLAERVARYISDKDFTLRKCQRYVKNNFGKGKQFFKDDDCVCGQSVSWHLKNRAFYKASVLKAEEWSLVKDTVPYPCDTFGELAFHPGFGIEQSMIVPGAGAKYIRIERRHVNVEQYMEDIFTLMTDPSLWNLPVPQLIIEVTGSAFPLPHVDQRAVEKFNAGIVAAAKSAKAWIVTGGMNCGVMKLVGDAVTKSRMTHVESKAIPCIGVASWGVVRYRNILTEPGVDAESEETVVRSPVMSFDNGNDHLRVDMNGGSQRKQSPSDDSTNKNDWQEYGGKWPANYVVEHQKPSDEPSLDPGHTAFLLVDNGQEKQFGEEITFRAQFLRYLSKKSIKSTVSDSGTAVPRTPLVLLVVGGDPKTLETVQASTSPSLEISDNDAKVKPNKSSDKEESWPRPVVIIPGFGGAADVLAFAYAITSPSEGHDSKLYRNSPAAVVKEPETTEFPSDFGRRVKRHPEFDSLFLPNQIKSSGAADTIVASIKACLKNRNLLTICNLFDENDEGKSMLDHAILNAIFKSDLQSDPVTTFQLAQLWKRCDVAKQIFRQHPEEIRNSVDINRAITRAIEMGEAQFFEFFIEYGLINLDSYLTLTQMRTFYEDFFIKRIGKAAKISCIQLFRSLLMNGTTDETLSDLNNPKFMENVGEVLSDLLACYVDNTFTGEKQRQRLNFSTADEDCSNEDLANALLRSETLSNLKYSLAYDTSRRDLFILLLLLNRQEMALQLWKIGHDQLGSALMAAIFLKSLFTEAGRLDMMDLAHSYDEQSSLWQDRAINLLDYCYDQDPLRSNRLLTRSLQTWQGLTILEMAYYGKKKRIMEHPAIQTKLAQIWLGRMATFTKPSLIYLTMFPPLLPFLIFRIRFEESTIFQRDAAELEALKALMASSAAVALPLSSSAVQYLNMANKSEKMTTSSKDQEKRSKRCLGSISPIESNSVDNVKGKNTPTSTFGRQNYSDKRLLKAFLFKSTNDQTKTVSLFKAVYFVYSSPIAKFVTHSLALLTFLFLFLSFVLIGPNPHQVSAIEIVIWLTSAVFFIDLLRESFGNKNLNFQEKLEYFFTDAWNCFDLLAVSLLTASVVERFTLPPESFVYPRTTYAVACVAYWVKSLHIFYVTKMLGPKVATLFKMLQDLAFFVLIYVIILLAFSAPIYSLLRPNAPIRSANDFWAVLLDVAFNRMWNLFAITMDDSQRFVTGYCPAKSNKKSSVLTQLLTNSSTASNNVTKAPTYVETTIANLMGMATNERDVVESPVEESCSERNVIAIILYVTFLLLTNIVLLNLLIAMFAHTVDETRVSAERLWRFNIYRFVHEFYKKPVLPGPLMIFELVYRAAKTLRGTADYLPPNTDFKEYYYSIDDFEYRKLEMFERSAVESMLVAEMREETKSGQNVVVAKLRRIHEKLSVKLDRVTDELHQFRAVITNDSYA